MEFGYAFTVGCSLSILFTVFIHAKKNTSVAGTRAFLWQIVFVTLWSAGSLMELLTPTEQGMLFWRNFEQIGVFLLPVSCMYFAVEYARYDRMKRYLPLLLIIPVAALLLIFTDSKTHIMRYDYIVSYSSLFGKALSVHSTPVGKTFVAYNYTLAFASLLILFLFSRQIAKNMRRQVILVMIATGLIFLFGLLKTAFLEGTRINIPIVTVYLPGSLVLYYNLYKNNFFYVSPLAREKVFDVIDQGIVVTDNSGMIVDKNPFAVYLLSSFFGVREELTGKKLDEVFQDYPDWVNAAKIGSSFDMEMEKGKESIRYIHIRVYPLQSHKGSGVGSVTIIRDITAVRLQELALKTKADTDSLTGLYNRAGFMDMFTAMLKESMATGQTVSVFLMDLDKFKDINDTFGHDGGDRVLQAFADTLRGILRRKDAVGRIGGDEFAVALPGINKMEALEIANRILEVTGERIIVLENGMSIRFSLSIGICDNENVKSEEDMLKCADKAMYIAKNRTGSYCMVWQ